jgi:hypothetical protein
MSRRYWRSALSAVCVAIIFAGEGCSDDDLPRQPVSGFVTLDGEPLSSGAISFYPDVFESSNFVVGGAMIKEGYFTIPRTHGLVPGGYDVAIHSAHLRQSRRGRDRAPGTDRAVEKERIPAKYNTQTHLAVAIKDAAIKEITFNLKSD